jgi:hypothetical protein
VEHKAVIGPSVVDTLCVAEFVQGAVEKSAGVITGERSPGAVRSPEPRREADDQQFRPFVAKRRDRSIKPFRMIGPLDLAECRKTRAEQTVPNRPHFPRQKTQASSTGSTRARLSSSRGWLRMTLGASSWSSMKLSACRRRSSETMGGEERIVDTTDTRTPLR